MSSEFLKNMLMSIPEAKHGGRLGLVIEAEGGENWVPINDIYPIMDGSLFCAVLPGAKQAYIIAKEQIKLTVDFSQLHEVITT